MFKETFQHSESQSEHFQSSLERGIGNQQPKHYHHHRSCGEVELDKQYYHHESGHRGHSHLPTFALTANLHLDFTLSLGARTCTTPMHMHMHIYSSLRRFDLGTADFILCCLCLPCGYKMHGPSLMSAFLAAG